MAAQVRQRTTHADEIVDQDVIGISRHGAIEARLSCQTGEAVGTGMCYDVGLHHAVINRPAKLFCHHVCQHFGNRIDPLAFVGMGADQYGMTITDQGTQALKQFRIENITHQFERCDIIAGFCRPVSRMLLDCRFGRVNQHIGKITPRSAWRLHGCDVITQNFPSYSL